MRRPVIKTAQLHTDVPKSNFIRDNGDRDVGKLDYSFRMVRALGLKWQDIWMPKSLIASASR